MDRNPVDSELVEAILGIKQKAKLQSFLLSCLHRSEVTKLNDRWRAALEFAEMLKREEKPTNVAVARAVDCSEQTVRRVREGIFQGGIAEKIAREQARKRSIRQ